MQDQTILVIGKNGKTGARVQRELMARGYTVRGVSRTSLPAFDWQDAATWRATLTGATSVYITFQPDLAVPGAEASIRALVAEAKSAGVEHLVLLSGRGEPGAQRAEQVVIQSGLAWNIVRASWFAQNFSESFMLDGVLQGELVLPACDTPEPFIDIDDLAEVAVAALTRPALRNRLFEVTGPRLMTFAECVQDIAAATGRPITLTSIPLADYIAAMQAQGLPADYQWLINELFSVVFDGRNSATADGVQHALGRPPTDFREYATKTAASGIWSIPASQTA